MDAGFRAVESKAWLTSKRSYRSTGRGGKLNEHTVNKVTTLWENDIEHVRQE